MSLENAIENLADAIRTLAAVQAGTMSTVKATEEEQGESPSPRGRGRPKKGQTDTPAADASGRQEGADTGSPAQTSTGEDAGAPASSAGTVVDAGTGKPVAADTDPKAVRQGVKAKGLRLTQVPGGNDKLRELLAKHSPAGTAPEAVKFGTVPDEAMPAFEADIDIAINSLSALSD